MAKTIVGLYHSYDDAQDVQRALLDHGVRGEHISVLAANPDDRYGDHVDRTLTAEEYDRYGNRDAWLRGGDTATDATADDVNSTAEGAVAGGLIGGVGAALLAVLVPGLGPLAASGWLVAGLVGLAGGALVGGLMGALVDAGVDEDDAVVYSEGVRRGYVLVSVIANHDDAARVADIMNQHGAINMDERTHYWRSEGWEGRYDADAPVYSREEIERERTGYDTFRSEVPEPNDSMMVEERQLHERDMQPDRRRTLGRT